MVVKSNADRFANLSKRPREAKDVRPVPRLALRIDEAAQSLGISRTTLYKLVQQGELRTFKIGSRTMLKVSMIEDFMTAREQSRGG